jgi:hypothetical protein
LLGRAPLGAAPGGAVDQGSGPAYLRFDLVDDRLVHTFPAGFDGDILIFGRSGSWVQEGVTVAAGGTLTIGPNAVPGAPGGLLAALGDIVGWLPVGRTTTQAERNKMRDYYMARGAKGFLVSSGVNRVANWLTTPASWTIYGNTTVSTENGNLLFIADQEISTGLSRGLSFAANRIYLIGFTVSPNTDFFLSTNGLNGNPWFRPGHASRDEFFVPTSSQTLFPGFSATTSQRTVSRLLVEEFRPEEEW